MTNSNVLCFVLFCLRKLLIISLYEWSKRILSIFKFQVCKLDNHEKLNVTRFCTGCIIFVWFILLKLFQSEVASSILNRDVVCADRIIFTWIGLSGTDRFIWVETTKSFQVLKFNQQYRSLTVVIFITVKCSAYVI